MLLALSPIAFGSAAAEDPIGVRVISGYAGVSLFERIERPFWQTRVPALTEGRIRPTVQTFRQAAVEPEQMLAIMRAGAVTIGGLVVNVLVPAEPELGVFDLPLLNPDLASFQRFAGEWRPRIAALLHDEYDTRLLATFIYPPQVLLCRGAFRGFADLKGRRIRIASIDQADFVVALGATPSVIGFDQITASLRGGLVDCAITALPSARAIGLTDVATHLSTLPLGWAPTLVVAAEARWVRLPLQDQTAIETALAALEREVAAAAEADAAEAEACVLARRGCTGAPPPRLTAVPVQAEDVALLRSIFRAQVLPGWVRRCGIGCAERWNALMGPLTGVFARW